MRVNKIGFAILSVLLFSVSINAAEITYVNAFPIYTYGDVDYLAAIFEFIKGIMSDDAVQTVFGMGFSISAFIAGVKTSKIGGLSEIVRSAAFPMSLYVFFAVPTVNVHIVDQRVDRGLINYVTPDGGYKKVEDVPYAMAFIPSSASLLVSAFIDLVDNNWFGVAEGNQFSTLGFQKTSEISKEALIIAKLKDINVASSGAVYDMNQYIKVCLIDQGLKSPANTHILTHATKPFPDMFDPANYVGNLSSQRVSFTDSNGTDVVDATCEDVYDTYVLSKASTIETEMGELLQKRFPTVDLNSATFNEGWREQIGDNIATVGTIQKMMATTAATRALERALDTEGIGVNGVSMATQLSIDATLTNLQTEGLAKWEWITRVLPDGLSIVLGILLGAMPLMVLVMSFMGSNAIKGAVFFTSGYVAINFNLVSMALVNNIIGIYTSKHAAEAMSAYAGMPFGLSQINDFMLKQADMAGLAGIIAGVSVFAVTPLIFKGETAGFGAAMSAVSGAFRGNVSQTAQKTLTDYDAQRTLDEQALTYNGMNEAEAAQWLHSEGFSIPNSMSAVQAYQDIMKNMTAIGAGSAAEILHHGNPNFNADNYIEGTKAQAISKAAQTAGYGQAVNNGVVSEAEIENVSIQDGNVMGAKTHAVAQDRDKAGFDAELVGYGQGHSQVAKEMGMQEIGADSDALEKLTASSRLQAKEQLASGEAAMNMFQGYNGFGALDVAGNDHIKNVMTKAAAKLMQSAGEGSTIDTDKALAKAYEDGARTGSATNKASDHMFSGTTDKDGRTLYDRDLAAEGQAMDEMARHQQNMQTATAASKFKTGEEDGYADFITGKGASARKDANDAIGVGEKFGAMNDKEQIDLMRQVKENAARGFEGGIKAANAELHAGVDKDGKRYDRSVEQAIADDVTGAQEKGISSSAHASNLKEKFGNDLKSITTVPEASEEAKAQLFDAMLNEQNPLKKAAMAKQLDAMINNAGETTSLAEVASNIDQSKLDSQLGQAIGIDKNMAMGVDYAQNSMYGEMSNQQSTKAKLDAQGGVEGAVKVDIVDASLKAATQQDVLDKNLTQAGAEKGIREEGINKLNDAIDKLAKTAGTLAAGKTASDIAGVDKYESPERYAEVQAQKASMMATIDKTRADKSDIQEQTQAKLDALITKANDKELAVSQALRSGAAMIGEDGKAVLTEDGRLKASTGAQFTDALAMFGAGDMETNAQMIMGGQRVNMDTDMDGNVLINRDSQENLKRGRKQEVGVSGYPEDIAGIAGEVLAAGVVGAAAIDGAYRKFGPKGNEGIEKPAVKGGLNQMASTFGFEKPFDTKVDESDNKRANVGGKDPTNPAKDEVKNSVHSTPPNKNSKDNIPKSGERVKTIAQEIEEQNKKMQILNADERYKADEERLKSRWKEQDRLNGGTTPEREALRAKDMAALQEQHLDRISKHKGAVEFADEKIKNQSWLEKNFGLKPSNIAQGFKGLTHGAMWDHIARDVVASDINQGNWKHGKATGAVMNFADAVFDGVMSGVTAAGGLVDKAIPFVNPIGQASKALGITNTDNLMKVSRSWAKDFQTDVGNAWTNASGIFNNSKVVAGFETPKRPSGAVYGMDGAILNPTAPPVAPPHIQNAFSTPTGFNTMTAMGVNPYAGGTPSGYKVDHSNDNLYATQDVNKGIDGVSDSILDLKEELSKSLKPNIDMDDVIKNNY